MLFPNPLLGAELGAEFKWESERLWVSNLVTGPVSLALERGQGRYWDEFMEVLSRRGLVKMHDADSPLCTWLRSASGSLFLGEGQGRCRMHSKPTSGLLLP